MSATFSFKDFVKTPKLGACLAPGLQTCQQIAGFTQVFCIFSPSVANITLCAVISHLLLYPLDASIGEQMASKSPALTLISGKHHFLEGVRGEGGGGGGARAGVG